MAKTVALRLDGEQDLLRILRGLEGPISRRMIRKSVNASLTPAVRVVRSNVPREIDAEGLLASRWPNVDLRVGGALRTVTTRKIKKTGKRRQKSRRAKDLTTVLRRSIGKRVKTYRPTGVTFGVVGPKTRIKVEIGKRRSASGRKSAKFISVSKLAELVEFGTDEVKAQPFVRTGVNRVASVIRAEFRRKMASELTREDFR